MLLRQAVAGFRRQTPNQVGRIFDAKGGVRGLSEAKRRELWRFLSAYII